MSGDANEGKTFFISPTFFSDAGCSKHTPTVNVSRKIAIQKSMLDRLEDFKCKVQFVAGGKDEG